MRNKFLGTGEPGYHPIRKLKVVASGLRFAVVYDFAVAYKVVLSAIVIVLSLVFRQWVDSVMILVATGMMMMAELFNSALEGVCDFLKTSKDDRIKVIKDMSAAATAIAIVTWCVVLAYEFSSMLFY